MNVNKIQRVIKFGPEEATLTDIVKLDKELVSNKGEDALSMLQGFASEAAKVTPRKPQKIVFYPVEPDVVTLNTKLKDNADVSITAVKEGIIPKQIKCVITKDGKFAGIKEMRKAQMLKEDIEHFFSQLQRNAKEGYEFLKEFTAAIMK